MQEVPEGRSKVGQRILLLGDEVRVYEVQKQVSQKYVNMER